MATDYTSIRADNERRYGTEIGRIGSMLLADRYDDRTHFIFELLQNAEDALARRYNWQGSRAVSLHDRPVGLSHIQFECARDHSNSYWLYVVECAGGTNARIQDPVGKARTFTFDQGWLHSASVIAEPE